MMRRFLRNKVPLFQQGVDAFLRDDVGKDEYRVQVRNDRYVFGQDSRDSRIKRRKKTPRKAFPQYDTGAISTRDLLAETTSRGKRCAGINPNNFPCYQLPNLV